MYEQAVKEKTSLESENATLRHELEELQCEANERQIQAAQTGRKRGRDGAVQPPAKRVQLVKGASNAKSTQAEAAGSNYDTLGYGTEGAMIDLVHGLFCRKH